MNSFSKIFNPQKTQTKTNALPKISSSDVEKILQKKSFNYGDFPALISPAAKDHLEHMAQRSKHITRQRFGYTMGIFAPLYLSNYCYNNCSYCGFSRDLKIPRNTLTQTELEQEAAILKLKGFDNLLLLTGEAPDEVGLKEFISAVQTLKRYVSAVGIEVQPMKQNDYETLIKAGCDFLAIYQETYHPETYKHVHTLGKKRNFNFRLDTADRGAKAGFYKINIGALLGLYDWRYEALAIAQHLKHLQQNYWQSKLGLSIPRIKPFEGSFSPNHPVSDSELLQFICAFRLVFPDLNISLSTREPAHLRNHLIHIGITEMSAESKTEPGGYSGKETLKQFETDDKRSLLNLLEFLKSQGIDPMTKDWERILA